MAAAFDFMEEAKRLIRFNTATWSSNADCAVHLGALMRNLGLSVFYQESRAGETLFLNVVGMLGEGKHPLLMATHLDTVEPGDRRLWTRTRGDPWKLVRRGNTLVGLGTADTKLDLLCKLSAVSRFKGVKPKRPLVLLGTFGEESGLRGAAWFCQGDAPRPAMALVGEPTELALVNRHKGLAVLELTLKSRGLLRPETALWGYELLFKGRASHSSAPDLGVNALEKAVEFLRQCGRRFGRTAVLSWEGGTGHNIIPAWSRLKITLGDRPKEPWVLSKEPWVLRSSAKAAAYRIQPGWYSTLPWQELLECVEMVQAALAPLQKDRDPAFRPPGLTWNMTCLREKKEGWVLTMDVRPLPAQSLHSAIKNLERRWWKRLGAPGPAWQWRLERDNPALLSDEPQPLLKMAKAALRAARLPVRTAAKAGCSEAGLYARVGIPALVFGPGRAAGNIHQPNECVAVGQLKRAIRFYEEFLKRACF